MPDWPAIAESASREGASPDAIAQQLLTAGASPIDAVKALHRIEGDLGRAKEVVHRNLAATQQANAERLWDAAERALSDE